MGQLLSVPMFLAGIVILRKGPVGKRIGSSMNHPEQQYLDLMQSLLDHGDQRMDRTGVGTYSDFGRTLRFDLSQGQTPVFTTSGWPGVMR